MHYQLPPAAEVKLVRCIRGGLHDLIVDLRPDSPTFGKWFGADLTAENRMMMYVPRGFAHGFVTLTEDAEALYLVSDPYAPSRSGGCASTIPGSAPNGRSRPAEISAEGRAPGRPSTPRLPRRRDAARPALTARPAAPRTDAEEEHA